MLSDDVVFKAAPALPYVPAQEKSYYWATQPVCRMFRPDGVPISFLHHIHECTSKHDHEYLENEIAAGNQMVRRATQEEVEHYMFSRDPAGFTRKQVEEEMDLKIEELVQQRIRERGYILPDPQTPTPEGVSGPSITEDIDDATKIAGVDKPATLAVRLGHATLTPTNTGQMPHKAG